MNKTKFIAQKVLAPFQETKQKLKKNIKISMYNSAQDLSNLFCRYYALLKLQWNIKFKNTFTRCIATDKSF